MALKFITAEEAAKLHPGGTVSAYSGLFMCELCGQYVILTDGDIRKRYFKHSAYEKSKDCPGHYKLVNTNISVCIDSVDSSICLYDYDRKDYFSVKLDQIKSGLNIFNLSIWNSLKEYEQKAIDSLIELISA